jgi:photosystem II stability/assembly factor-like uncharacterized protein
MRASWVLCAVFLTAPAFAEPWSSAGPYGGAITAFAAASSRVFYAGSAGGVFKSEDGGATWRDISHGLRNVVMIAASPDSITAYVVAGSRLYKSIDSATWTDITQGLLSELRPTALIVDPQNAKTLYVGSTCIPDFISVEFTGAAGVYKSTDGGQNWTRIVNGLTGFEVCVNELSLDPAAPSHLFMGGIFENWQSFDSGATWQRASIALPARRVVGHPQLPLTRYGIENANGHSVLASNDGGATWTATAARGLPASPLVSAPLFYDLAIDPATARLFLATAQGTFRSGDGGGNWIPVGGTSPRLPGYGVAVDSIDSRLILATAQGVSYASLPGGDPWSENAINDLSTDVVSIAVDPTNLAIVYAATVDAVNASGLPTLSRVFRSRDGGRSWQLVRDDDPRPHTIVALTVDAAGDLYAAGPYGFSRLPAGSDGWVHQFVETLSTSTLSRSVTADPHQPGVIFLCSSLFGLQRTRDGGKTWQTIPYLVNQIAIDPTDSRRVYAASPFGFWSSTDGGDTFPGIFPPPFPPPFPPAPPPPLTWSVAVAASRPNVIYKVSAAGLLPFALFRSEDFGVTWKSLQYPAGDSRPPQVLIDPHDDKVVYIISFNHGVLRSADGGRIWTSLNSGLVDTAVNTGVIDPANQFLRVGTQSAGAWQMQLAPRGRAVRPH